MTEKTRGAASAKIQQTRGLDRGPFVAEQHWLDLLFAHWPVPKRTLEPLVPAGLELDLWEGGAWVGVVPFRLEGLKARGLVGIPSATDFLELNVRTYVKVGDLTGVYFFSLDASSSLAVLGARTMFGLPYHKAEMSFTRVDDWIHYRSERESDGAKFIARYRAAGIPQIPPVGSLEEFLTERYRLFTAVDGHVRRVEIDHEPWRLRPAEVVITTNTMTEGLGVTLPDQAPFAHFVDRQDVVNGLPM